MAKFFDKGTFLSCIKRLKTLAIVASIVSAVLSVALYLIIFSTVQSIIIPQTYNAYSISTTTFASILPGASVIFALVATLCAFGFLTNRAHSDFFHSLPQTREASFVSNIAAVTVTGAMVTVTGALALLVANICTQQFIEINLLQFAHLTLNTVIGVFLTAASVGIAVSITGTRFSNLIVSLIIIYLPQLLLSLTIGTVSGTLPSPLISGKIFAYELIGHNLAAGWLLNGSSLTSLTATIYSLLLGAGYTVLGAYLYKRRRSEMAGVSAPSRLMQDIYRTLVGVTMFSIVTSLIFTNAHFSVYGLLIAEDDPLFIILLITMAAISAILYFLYELITTKSGGIWAGRRLGWW